MTLPDNYTTWAAFWKKEVKPALERYPDTQELFYKYMLPSGVTIDCHYKLVEVKAALFDELLKSVGAIWNDIHSQYDFEGKYSAYRIEKVCYEFGILHN